MMRVLRHGRENILRARLVDYVDGQPWNGWHPDSKLGSYTTDKDTLNTWSVFIGDSCAWYSDDAVGQWYKRMEEEYGSRDTW